MPENAFIHLFDITKTYSLGNNPVKALDRLNLNLSKGEFIAVTGKSGCGKSTLINIIGGLDYPDRGEVIIDGDDLARMDDRRLTLFRRNRIGIIFQFFNLLPILTVEENIALPHLLMGKSNPPAAKMDRLLSEMGLEKRRHHKPHELSGGEMQRAALCRALINDPEIILADEPTGNLDSLAGKRVLEILRRLNRDQGKTILLVTHSQEGAMVANRVLRMQDGRLFTG
jgi:ABC-type lipoprotein export system ATPase subunit